MLADRLSGVARRWSESAVPRERAQEVRQRLRSGVSLSELGELHEDVRNSVRLHLRVHWRIVRAGRADPLPRRLQELERLIAAPLSSVGRRLGGCPPDAPQDDGLAETWARVLRTLWSG